MAKFRASRAAASSRRADQAAGAPAKVSRSGAGSLRSLGQGESGGEAVEREKEGEKEERQPWPAAALL